MSLATAVINELADHGIDTVFGLPGLQTLPLNEAINSHPDVQYVMARHETAVSHQAWGYSQSSGRTAATLVLPGPGDMNAMNGLKNALNDCTPLVHITAETETDVRGGEAIHEASPDMYDDVVKQNILVSAPESAIGELRRAIATAQTPPKGPVRVGIPKDFLSADAGHTDSSTYSTTPFDDAPEDVTDAAEMLAAAESAIIVAGGGIRIADASEELCAIAEKLDAPVLTTRKGKGVIPEDHPLSAGVLSKSIPELREHISDTDIVLGAGTDFDAQATRSWSIPLPDQLIHVTIQPDELGRGYDPDIGLVGDAKNVLAAIDAELETADTIESSGGAEIVRRIRELVTARLAGLADVSEPPLTSVSALHAIHEVLPRETIISTDVGGFRTWSFLPGVFEVYGPRQQILPGSWGTMGTGLPAAIGAKMANPDTPVVTLTGDGGLLMCVEELHTAVAEQLPITVVVLNNNDYAIISEGTKRNTRDSFEYTWQDSPIKFASLATSMGAQSAKAETPDAIQQELSAALETSQPSLVEIPIDPDDPQVNWWLTE